jgi:hypothetical protein
MTVKLVEDLIAAVNAAWREEDYTFRKYQQAYAAWQTAKERLDAANNALEKAQGGE